MIIVYQPHPSWPLLPYLDSQFVPISIILIHNLYKEKQLVLEEISDLLLQKMCMKQLNGILNWNQGIIAQFKLTF